MSQLSMFGFSLGRLDTFENVDEMLESVREGETDKDLFGKKTTKTGRSYFIYGTKVFEFKPKTDNKPSVIKVDFETQLFYDEGSKEKSTQGFAPIEVSSSEDVLRLIEALKNRKKNLFDSLLTETFACCSDYLRCSDKRACVHQDKRFYNGCVYRKSLEQGRIFYGENRNID